MSTAAVLVVTNRPDFIPWWTHQIRKQTRRPDEVVVVTNALDPSKYVDGSIAELCGVRDTIVYWQPPEPWVSLGWIRQKALDLCRSDVFMWMDDDDWYHPSRVELSCAPIESGRYDAAVFPLTHYYYLNDRSLRHMRTDIMMHLPAVAWRRASVRKARFFHISSAEDCHWIHRIVHCHWAPPLIPASRIYWVNDYAYPNIGAMIVVHGGNTWQDLNRVAHDEATKTVLSPYPPSGVSRQEWRHTVEFLTSMVPSPQRKRVPFKPSTREEWDLAHQSGFVD